MKTAFLNIFRRPPRVRATPLADAWLDALGGRVKSVLFADDDPGIGYMVKDMERMLQMEVTVVTTVAEAKRLLAERSFDIAILDFRLLNGNTVPVYEKILSDQPKTYVIFITGGSLDEVSRAVHARGPAGVFPKPEILNLGFLANLLGMMGVKPRRQFPEHA